MTLKDWILTRRLSREGYSKRDFTRITMRASRYRARIREMQDSDLQTILRENIGKIPCNFEAENGEIKSLVFKTNEQYIEVMRLFLSLSGKKVGKEII